MNGKQNISTKETVIKLPNNPKIELCMNNSVTTEAAQEEEAKLSKLPSRKERSFEENNYLENESIQDLDGNEERKGKYKVGTLLKRKRHRSPITPEESVLDMDYLQSFTVSLDLKINPFYDPKSKLSLSQRSKAHQMQAINRFKSKVKLNHLYQTRQCHICNEKCSIIEMKTCSMKNCYLFFCTTCLIRYNDVDDYHNSEGNYDINNWKCLKCRGKCKCHRCRVINRKKTKNLLTSSTERDVIDLKGLIKISLPPRVNHIERKVVSINDFTLYEIYKDDGLIHPDSININYAMDIDDGFNINLLANKEIIRLQTIAKQCEEYYIQRQNEGLLNEEQYSRLTCFRCSEQNFENNELLHFSSKKELMNYFKFCFMTLEKTLRINCQAFVKNKQDLSKYDSSFLSKWKFYQERVICKYCFMLLINMDNLVIHIKNIFNDENLPMASHTLNNNNNKKYMLYNPPDQGHGKRAKKRLGIRINTHSHAYLQKKALKQRKEDKKQQESIYSINNDHRSLSETRQNKDCVMNDESTNCKKSKANKKLKYTNKSYNNIKEKDNKNVSYDKSRQVLIISKNIFSNNETDTYLHTEGTNHNYNPSNKKHSRETYDLINIDSMLSGEEAKSSSNSNLCANSLGNSSIQEQPITFQYDTNNIISNFNVLELYYLSEKINNKIKSFLEMLPRIYQQLIKDFYNNTNYQIQIVIICNVMKGFTSNLNNHLKKIEKLKESLSLLQKEVMVDEMIEIVTGLEMDTKQQIEKMGEIMGQFLETAKKYYGVITEQKLQKNQCLLVQSQGNKK